MRKKKTQRGFGYYEFKDCNGIDCSIQESSLATKHAIWLGADKIGLKALIAGSGWQEMNHLDSDGLHIANNRMHLTQKEVKKILPILIKFAETGEI